MTRRPPSPSSWRRTWRKRAMPVESTNSQLCRPTRIASFWRATRCSTACSRSTLQRSSSPSSCSSQRPPPRSRSATCRICPPAMPRILPGRPPRPELHQLLHPAGVEVDAVRVSGAPPRFRRAARRPPPTGSSAPPAHPARAAAAGSRRGRGSARRSPPPRPPSAPSPRAPGRGGGRTGRRPCVPAALSAPAARSVPRPPPDDPAIRVVAQTQAELLGFLAHLHGRGQLVDLLPGNPQRILAPDLRPGDPAREPGQAARQPSGVEPLTDQQGGDTWRVAAQLDVVDAADAFPLGVADLLVEQAVDHIDVALRLHPPPALVASSSGIAASARTTITAK